MAQDTSTGIELNVVPAAPGLDIEIQRAPDNGAGSPDAANAETVAIIPSEQVDASGVRFTDQPLPEDGVFRHYRFRHAPQDQEPGPWTEWTKVKPAKLTGGAATVLSVALGGTGQSALPAGRLVVGNGASGVTALPDPAGTAPADGDVATWNAAQQKMEMRTPSVLAPLAPSPAGTYGSATKIAVPTVDQFGRVTSVSEVNVSGGGSGTTATLGPNGVTAHRMWRVRGHANGNVLAIAELQLRNAPGGGSLAGINIGGALAISSGNYSGTTAANAFDSLTNTSWASAAATSASATAWVGWDFGPGNAYAVSEIEITPRSTNPEQGPQWFVVECSHDGVNWTLVATYNPGNWSAVYNPPTDPRVFTGAGVSGSLNAANPNALPDTAIQGPPDDGEILRYRAADRKWTDGDLTSILCREPNGTMYFVLNGRLTKVLGTPAAGNVPTFQSDGTIMWAAQTGSGTGGGTTGTGRRWFRVRGYSNGGYVGHMEIQLATAAGGANVATGGTASASSSYSGLPASAAFDGNPTTAWATASGGTSSTNQAWISYDFGPGTLRNVVEVRIMPRNESDQRPVDTLSFESSDDGVTYSVDWTALNPVWTAGQYTVFTRP